MSHSSLQHIVCLAITFPVSRVSRYLDLREWIHTDHLTSSVRDVLAVKGYAFPLVKNERVLQQVYRGESVSAQGREDEIQKTDHPSLQTSRELLTTTKKDQRKPVQIINLLKNSARIPTPLSLQLQVNRSTSLTEDNRFSVFSSRNEQDWQVWPKNVALLLTCNIQGCKNQLIKHWLLTQSSPPTPARWPLPCLWQYYSTLFKMLSLSWDSCSFCVHCVAYNTFGRLF